MIKAGMPPLLSATALAALGVVPNTSGHVNAAGAETSSWGSSFGAITFAGTSPQVTGLPAGTYLFLAQVTVAGNGGGDEGAGTIRIRKSTDTPATLGATAAAQSAYDVVNDSPMPTTTTLACVATLADSSSTVRLEYGERPGSTTATLVAGGASLSYVRLA